MHPADDEEYHELYLMCDDVDATIRDLDGKGVKTTPISEQPWGRVTQISLASGDTLGLYQPKHPTAIGR